MDKKNTTTFLQQVPLFQDLNVQELERVEEITISRSVTRKSVIFSEGIEKEAVFFIKEGLVKTYKTDESGHEQIISFLKVGDIALLLPYSLCLPSFLLCQIQNSLHQL